MTEENYSIKIADEVSPGIERKLGSIEKQARSTHTAIDRIQQALAKLNPTGLRQIDAALSSSQKAIDRAALASQRLATEQQRTAAAVSRAAQAQARANTATAQAEAAQARAETAAIRLSAAQDRVAASAARSAQAQARATQADEERARQLRLNEAELERVRGVQERFDAVLARNPKAAQNFASGLGETAKKAGLARHELQNLAFQANDVVVSLGSGQRPLQVLLQQGAQIGQIFGASGVGAGAIFRQLASIVGTLLLRLAPLGVAIGAVLAPFSLFTREINKGIDGNKLVADLNLTEKQLEKLKKSGEETRVTFGDTFKAVFQTIGRYIGDYFAKDFEKIKSIVSNVLDAAGSFIAAWAKQMIGTFLAMSNVIKLVYQVGIVEYFKTGFKNAANVAIGIIESMVNTIAGALANSPIAKLLGIDSAPAIKLPRIELTDAQKDISSGFYDAIQSGFEQGKKVVDQFGKDVRAQAIKNAQARLRAAAGDPDKDKKTKAAKGFDRAAELARINAELDSQARNMFKLADARDAYARVDEIAMRFAKEGKALTEDEITALRNKIQALNDARVVQQQFDRIYTEVSGPLKTYNATLEAADKLLQMGAISQAQHAAQTAKATRDYEDASTAFGKFNRELDEQMKILSVLPSKRGVEQQLQQAINDAIAAGKPIREQEIADLRAKLELVERLNIASAAADSIYANSTAKRSQDTSAKIGAAAGMVGKDGVTRGDAVAELATEIPGLDQTAEFLIAKQEQYAGYYAAIDEMRQADLISESSAVAAKIAIFEQQYQAQFAAASNALGALASLQGSQNKKQAEIGKKAAIAQTVINTYQSATSAYSSLASIPYVGPFLGAAAAAAAIAAGMANVQRIRAQPTGGYMDGGYTGNIPRTAVAGDVHGQEYVFDANATSRIGVGNLEALRNNKLRVSDLAHDDGTSASRRNSRARIDGENNVVVNQTTVVQVQGRMDRKTPDQIARAERRQTVKEYSRNT